MRIIRLSATALALACLLAAPSPIRPITASAADCEGDACSQVTLSFDEAKGQYRARNDSSSRWAKVSASNLSASAAACLAPGKEAFLPLKSVVGAYRADYAEPKCASGALDF